MQVAPMKLITFHPNLLGHMFELSASKISQAESG